MARRFSPWALRKRSSSWRRKTCVAGASPSVKAFDCKLTGKSLIHTARSCSLGADRRSLGIEGALVGGHKLGRPRKAGQGHVLETSAAAVTPRSAMPVDEAVHVFR